jgi:tetratricopeptide (TPR) repeat protein
MLKYIFLIMTVIIVSSSVSSRTDKNKLSTDEWNEDINTIVEEMSNVHVNPYHTTSKKDFEKYADELKINLFSLSDNEVIARIAEMVAMIGDGHTVLDISGFHNNNLNTSVFNFHAFPLQTYIFDKGVYVIYADKKNKELEGKKLVKINNTDIEIVLNKMKAIVPGDNEYNKKFSLPFFIVNAEYLNGLGLLDNTDKCEFTFEDKAGILTSEIIESVSLPNYNNIIHNNPELLDAPLYLQNESKNYWFKYLENEKILYINYKRVLIDPNDSLRYFCKRLNEFINSHEIDKTIIDIRNNGGGNNGTCQPFVNLISNNKKVNVKGKLFTIIGRQTFSAASYLCTKLEFNTNTIFVGEPTGAKPNHYGDNRPLTLPNSGLIVRLSSIYWRNSFPFDKRKWTEPEIIVSLTPENYFGNTDPVMEAVLNYNPEIVNSEKVTASVNKSLIGKYIYQPLQFLEIREDGNDLKLEIKAKDFIGRDVTFISTNLYSSSGNKFNTGINGFSISVTDRGLKLTYKGTDRDIQKADPDYKLPEELIAEGKIIDAINLLTETKNKFPDNEKVSENEINGLGYFCLNNNKLDFALEIFKLNTRIYPEAFNTFDSLGEAQMIAGDYDSALINYRKSVELNSNNENGKKMIEKLQVK